MNVDSSLAAASSSLALVLQPTSTDARRRGEMSLIRLFTFEPF
jgi:hypothetical protein